MFKSTNGGASWASLSAGLTNTYINALAIDPATPAILYAGTRGSGVFSIHQELAVTSVGPGIGLATGSTPVTILGAGFVPGATVIMGGVAAGNVSYIDSTTLTATTGAHSPGAVDVVVTNLDQHSVTLRNGFVYADVVDQVYLPVTSR